MRSGSGALRAPLILVSPVIGAGLRTAPALTLAATDWLDCHTRSFAAAICSMLRAVSTLSGRSSTINPSGPSRANSSASLNSNQLSPAYLLLRLFTRFQPPLSFSPWSSNLRCPLANASSASVFGVHVPRSQTMTVPAPYCLAGMTPSNSPYSSGWSSTCIARRLSLGSRLGPLGTAQLNSTPLSSSRKS